VLIKRRRQADRQDQLRADAVEKVGLEDVVKS
jgi:hypothetical protein